MRRGPSDRLVLLLAQTCRVGPMVGESVPVGRTQHSKAVGEQGARPIAIESSPHPRRAVMRSFIHPAVRGDAAEAEQVHAHHVAGAAGAAVARQRDELLAGIGVGDQPHRAHALAPAARAARR